MKIFIKFVTLLFLCHFQWLNANSCGPVFQARPFHHLNITRLAVKFVHHYMDCFFACLQNMLCVSFNVAVNADDQGELRCELLPSRSSNNTTNLTADPQFHLYEIKSPCHSMPCYNNGTCSPISYRDETYRCTCHPGYLGRLCETEQIGEIRDSAIVGNNEAHLTKLAKWLEPVMHSGHHWKLCWRASRDGWGASTFHSNCDNKGPTVTIIKVHKYIFGGYTSVSWNVNGGVQSDKTAFLFSLVNKPGWDPLTMTQPGQGDTSYSRSVISGSNVGPTFGSGYDLHIADHASSNANSYTNLGYSYSPPPGHSYSSEFTKTFLSGGSNGHFMPNEIETYYQSK